VPEEGEHIDFEGLVFEVELLEGQRITDVRIWFPGHPESAADSGR
jgi:CBS domain containing-hemolysin-like protein